MRLRITPPDEWEFRSGEITKKRACLYQGKKLIASTYFDMERHPGILKDDMYGQLFARSPFELSRSPSSFCRFVAVLQRGLTKKYMLLMALTENDEAVLALLQMRMKCSNAQAQKMKKDGNQEKHKV